MPKTTIAEKYLAHVVKQDGCWGWAHIKHGDGYGLFSHEGKIHYAHRASYAIHIGDLPAGMDVMHLCHNPVCSNPAHLETGTRKQNMGTSFAAGRLQREIPLGDLPLIAARRTQGHTLQQVASDYGCTKQAVRHMLNAHPELCGA